MTISVRARGRLFLSIANAESEDCLVYLIVAERRLVPSEAQAPQPDHNVHDGAYKSGRRASSSGEARVSRGGVGVPRRILFYCQRACGSFQRNTLRIVICLARVTREA
jgi:hypothetical protein